MTLLCMGGTQVFDTQKGRKKKGKEESSIREI
jgi:hypothetical protein